MRLRSLLCLVLLLAPVGLAIAAQIGAPPARTWTHRQIRVADEFPEPPFTWMVQARNGLLYLADQRGLLEFDGANWRRVPLPSDSAVYAVGLAHDGGLVVGGGETLHHLRIDGGVIHASSLAEVVEGGLRRLGNFWEIGTDGKTWCARSEPALVCTSDDGTRVLGSSAKLFEFGRLFEAGGELLVQQVEVGIVRVTAAGLEPIPELRPVGKEGVYTIVSPRPGRFMALTKNTSGFWTWSRGEAPVFQKTEVIASLLPPIGQGVVIAEGLVAFPEENGSVVVIDDSGRLVERIDPPETGVGRGAQSLLLDHEGGLWIVWRNGVTRTEYPSRLGVFKMPDGALTGSYTIARTDTGLLTHVGEDVYQIVGLDGLKPWRFDRIRTDLPHVMFVDALHGKPVAGTIEGIVDLGTGQRLITDRYALSSAPRLGSTNEFWVGIRFGVSHVFRDSGGELHERSRLDEVTFDVSSIAQPDARSLWLGSDVGRAARVDLALDLPFGRAPVEEFDQPDGLPRAAVRMLSFGDRIFAAAAPTILEWEDGRFVPSNRIPASETGVVANVAKVDEEQLLVVDPKSRIRLLQRDLTGIFRHVPGVFDEIVGLGRISNILIDPDDIVWFATDIGIVRVDPKVNVVTGTPQQVLIRDVIVDDRPIQYSSATHLELPESSSLRVAFALPSFRDAEMNRYRSRIRLVDGDASWSAWTNESRRDFTNLPAGDHVFEVEAEDAAGRSGGLASIPVVVVAPWYRQTWAIAGFWAGALMVLLLGVQWRVRALRARSAELERLVAIKTEALQIAATTDPLTGLWNRHRFGQWVRDEVPKINTAVAGAATDDRVDLIACVIDLDHFKRVNDQHGHAAGDAVLKAVAERLQAMRENGDLVFRFGGEEFVYLGINRHRDEGKKLAERIVHEIAQINVELESGVLLDPTASVGWSVYPFYRERADLFSLDFVLGLADRALYLAKQVGRNRAYGYLPNIDVESIDRTQADWRAQVFNRHTDFLRRV